jgi:aminobenzoyl-glutamate utilization protein B
MKRLLAIAIALTTLANPALAQDSAPVEAAPPLSGLKAEAAALVDGKAKLTQEIVDSLFSFSELGFQEFETQRYLTELLEANGFTVEQGVSGIPSAWWATWGSGEPVIALGSDVDGIPKSSQYPGVLARKPMVDGAPGHGEGHNSGQAVNITAALAVKELMERENLPGTLVIWPGIAEELVATKAWFARDGRYEDVDAVLFTHVSDSMSVSWGQATGTGLVSVEYTFEGQAAHGAGDPWKGRSALDAVELMNVGWNFRREHLRPLQRSHYVIVDGGDQPNVVPSKATVWYFIREITAEHIRENFAALQRMADGAAMMTDTDGVAAHHRHGVSAPLQQTHRRSHARICRPWACRTGLRMTSFLPKRFRSSWSADEIQPLKSEIEELAAPREEPKSGGSDDIGDVSWNVPTVTLRFPSNIDGRTGHHWSSAIAMATPIAHKGATAGAKVIAATMLDLLQDESLRESAWSYFRDEQTANETYMPFIGAEDAPAIEKNAGIMGQYKEALREFYYDPDNYATYLEQLGIDYPQLEVGSDD